MSGVRGQLHDLHLGQLPACCCCAHSLQPHSLHCAQAGTMGFIPFLSQDNLDLSHVQTQQVIRAIDQDLAQLLRLPPQQFWQVVCSDDSLHACLDSFLRFRR